MELNPILERLKQLLLPPSPGQPVILTPEQEEEVQRLIDQSLQQMRDADQGKLARALQEHVGVESQSETGLHPDGCYFCGGNHPTLGCPESQDWPH